MPLKRGTATISTLGSTLGSGTLNLWRPDSFNQQVLPEQLDDSAAATLGRGKFIKSASIKTRRSVKNVGFRECCVGISYANARTSQVAAIAQPILQLPIKKIGPHNAEPSQGRV